MDKPLKDIIWDRLSSQMGASSETVQKITFGHGAVGKIAIIAVFALLTLGAIGVRLGGALALWAILGIVAVTVLVLALVFYIVWKRPALAVMEGTELLQYHNALLLAAKGQIAIPLQAAGEAQPGLVAPTTEGSQGNA